MVLLPSHHGHIVGKSAPHHRVLLIARLSADLGTDVVEEFLGRDDTIVVGISTTAQPVLQGIGEKSVGHPRVFDRYFIASAREEEHNVAILFHASAPTPRVAILAHSSRETSIGKDHLVAALACRHSRIDASIIEYAVVANEASRHTVSAEEHDHNIIRGSLCSHSSQGSFDCREPSLTIDEERSLSTTILLIHPLHGGSIVVRQAKVVLSAGIVGYTYREQIDLRLALQRYSSQ